MNVPAEHFTSSRMAAVGIKLDVLAPSWMSRRLT
jgi:hypothetical protein